MFSCDLEMSFLKVIMVVWYAIVRSTINLSELGAFFNIIA